MKTPKEKAKELVYKKFGCSKRYALIAVDEIMKAIGWEEMELGVERDNYWEEVKQEIELL